MSYEALHKRLNIEHHKPRKKWELTHAISKEDAAPAPLMALVVLLLLEIRWIGKQIFKYLLGYKSTFYGQLIITIINDVSVRDPRNSHQHEQDILWNTWDTTHSIKSHILTPNQLNFFFNQTLH